MTDLVRRAELFAREQHIRQFRKGYAHEPYIAQVEEVAELACIWAALTPPWRLRDCTAQLRTAYKPIYCEHINSDFYHVH